MQLWEKQLDGSFLRKIGNLRMVILPNLINGTVRFILIQDAANYPDTGAMIRSGHTESVACAMAAAENIAVRLMALMAPTASQEHRLPDAKQAA